MEMFDFMNIIKALSDENRLRILMALRDRELCVCQMTALLDLAPSTTSKHLSILRQARLIESEKHGKWVYYRLAAGANARETVNEALLLVHDSLEMNPVIMADVARLQVIMASGDAVCRAGGTAEDDEMHAPAIHALEAAMLASE